MTPDDIITDVLRREGDKYTNHPADAGGPTKYGITQKTLGVYRKRPVTPEDVAALTEDEARQIYRVFYVYPFAYVKGPALKALMVDCAVLHGVSRATTWLQGAAGVRADGKPGPITEAALGALDAAMEQAVYRAVLRSRVKFLGALITAKPSQAVFAAGWFNRVAEFI